MYMAPHRLVKILNLILMTKLAWAKLYCSL